MLGYGWWGGKGFTWLGYEGEGKGRKGVYVGLNLVNKWIWRFCSIFNHGISSLCIVFFSFLGGIGGIVD